ncbi:metallopeptidase family protein [Anaerosphaera multitolerans]|uniref:Metallopeptidase family protein n=1 Tax=Anaerosphaera multitolerans TaxID=2487351 RepID=A0A437S864_9FIRM|nr:metallopeptidase family protein [Anaerosphaera multitolerans]RVU55121.1 metallopeptidase family protein [Anaerosphaera multitolerans]
MVDRFEEFEEILNELYDELPKRILEGLNGGIRIVEDISYHPADEDGGLVILGAYKRDILGKSILIYYGSFMELYGHMSREALKDKVRSTLHHEITHHLEFLAGEKDLEIEDAKFLMEFKRRKNE